MSRIETLLSCIGLDSKSFSGFLEWALTEHLVVALSKISPERRVDYFGSPDGMKRFRNDLREKTKRNWSDHDLNALYAAVRRRLDSHFRETVHYSEYLRLLWTQPHECRMCGRRPPEIKLHIDHVIPVSLGGDSKYANIQFLCERCNLYKSDNMIGGKPWLDLL
jgi:5-methylcytosine-specific restriction endonuclease McrA